MPSSLRSILRRHAQADPQPQPRRPALPRPRGPLAALAIVAVMLSTAVDAQAPLGDDFQVNSTTSADQEDASIAVSANGSFVVVWMSDTSTSGGSDSSDTSIQGQRFDAAGGPLGAEFQVNTYTTSFQTNPSVASDAAGNFVVVWTSIGSDGGDDSYTSIQGQRFEQTGAVIGGQFQVNTYVTGTQDFSQVAANGDGDFVVVWQSDGSPGTDVDARSIQGQRFALNGTPMGAQFQVNSYTTGFQSAPTVAIDDNRDFVAVWQSDGSGDSDDSSLSTQGQRFAADGTPLGGEFQINSYTEGIQFGPAVASWPEGDFVVAWASNGSTGTDSSSNSVQGQRFDGDGLALGSQFQVNTYTTSAQGYLSVATDSGGNFVVVWSSGGSSGSDSSSNSIQGQQFDASGAALGGEFQVNTYTTGNQFYPVVASRPNGDFVVAWQSAGSSGSDSSNNSVQARRFRSIVIFEDGFESGNTSAWQ